MRIHKALIPFITAGDPSLTMTKELVLVLERGGADLVELGIPFSDPMADGPVIQKASERALRKGTTLKTVLRVVREIRRESRIPILLMGYYNPIYAYGLKRYAADAARAGVNATLVVDLPPEESDALDRELKKVEISLIYLLAPTSDVRRIRLVAHRARGFIYFVSMTGITGSRLAATKEIERKVREIRRETRLPIVVGFGVSTPHQAAALSKFADGVVIGSALVEKIHLLSQNSSTRKVSAEAEKFIRQIKSAITR